MILYIKLTWIAQSVKWLVDIKQDDGSYISYRGTDVPVFNSTARMAEGLTQPRMPWVRFLRGKAVTEADLSPSCNTEVAYTV
jgi:hypothetical protein